MLNVNLARADADCQVSWNRLGGLSESQNMFEIIINLSFLLMAA